MAESAQTFTTGRIIRVGDGRGFIVEGLDVVGRRNRYVLTAAHCLEGLLEGKCPRAHPARYVDDAIYKDILGPLSEKPTVWAECLYVDPIADIAILGSPDKL